MMEEQQQQPVVYEFAQWEGSKENIQPLKRGRKPSELKKAFAPLQPIQQPQQQQQTSSADVDNETDCTNISIHMDTNTNNNDPTIVCFTNHNTKVKHAMERAEWEKQIAQVSTRINNPQEPYDLGSEHDPLTTWIDYLTWIEDNYPTLDSSSQFVETLHKCTQLFLCDERYKTHRRFVLLWLRYIDTCKDPLDVFAFMHSNNIGLDVAEFYIAWATALEDHRDFRAADSVLEQGYHRKAEPFKKMELSHESFKHRFMENIMKESMLDMSIHSANSPVQLSRQVPASSNISSTVAPFGIQQQHQHQPQQQFTRVAFNPITQREATTGMRPTALQAPTRMSPIHQRTNQRTNNASMASGFARQRSSVSNGMVVRRSTATHSALSSSSASSLSSSSSSLLSSTNGGIRKKSSSNSLGNFQVFDESGTSTPASKKRRLLPSCVNIPGVSGSSSSSRSAGSASSGFTAPTSSTSSFGSMSSMLNQPTRTLPFDVPRASTSTASTNGGSGLSHWSYLPSEKESQKENHDLPTQWTNYTVQQDLSLDQPASFALPHVKKPEEESVSFTIFEDDDEQ